MLNDTPIPISPHGSGENILWVSLVLRLSVRPLIQPSPIMRLSAHIILLHYYERPESNHIVKVLSV